MYTALFALTGLQTDTVFNKIQKYIYFFSIRPTIIFVYTKVKPTVCERVMKKLLKHTYVQYKQLNPLFLRVVVRTMLKGTLWAFSDPNFDIIQFFYKTDFL